MALARDASSPPIATNSVGSTATVTCASFTPPDGALITVLWSGNSQPGTNPGTPTITDNLGGHLTYTLSDWQSRADAPADDGQCAIWTATVVTGTPMTISVTNGSATSTKQSALCVEVWTGQDPAVYTGAHGKTAANASSIAQNYTAAATGGMGLLVTCDWDDVGAQTAGAGCQLDGSASLSAITYGFISRTLFDDSAGATNTLRANLPSTSANLNWCWLEILPLDVPIDPAIPVSTVPLWFLQQLITARSQAGSVPDPGQLGFAPPTLVQYVETDFSGTGASKNTPVINWIAGDLIVVLGGIEAQGRSLAPTATGLTFLTDTPLTDVSTCWANSWHVVAPSAGSSAVTITLTGTAVQYGAGVWVYRGSNGTGVRVVDSTASKILTVNRSGSHSRLVEGLFDFDAGSVAGHVWAPAGQTEDEAAAQTGYTVYIADWPDQGDAGQAVYGISGTASTGLHSKIALEILGSLAIPVTGALLLSTPPFTWPVIPAPRLFATSAPSVVVAAATTPQPLVPTYVCCPPWPAIPPVAISSNFPLGNPAVPTPGPMVEGPLFAWTPPTPAIITSGPVQPGAPRPLVVTPPWTPVYIPPVLLSASQPLGNPAVGTPGPLVVTPAPPQPQTYPAAISTNPAAPAAVVTGSTPTALVVGPVFAWPLIPLAYTSASQPLGNPAVGSPQPLVPLVPQPTQPIPVARIFAAPGQPGAPMPLVPATPQPVPAMPAVRIFAAPAQPGAPQALVVTSNWTSPRTPAAFISSAPGVTTTFTATPQPLVISPPWQPVRIPRHYLSSNFPLGNPAVGSPKPLVVSPTQYWPARTPALLLPGGGGVAVLCETPRPTSGTTARPGSGLTVRPSGSTTSRPGSGVTVRPNTGTTNTPC